MMTLEINNHTDTICCLQVLAREQLTKKAQEFSHKPFISSFNLRPEKVRGWGLSQTCAD